MATVEAKPSRTSQVVALTRASFTRPHTPGGDPAAQASLCAGMRPAATNLREHLAVRTRFFDDQVLGALDRGVRQIVVLGAGYDDRALRFRWPGARYFEVDHPGTQADKRRRLQRIGADLAGLTLVPADFRHDDAGAALAASGHDGRRPSLFLCEGLLVYLDEPVITQLLTGLRARAGDGSALAASIAVHAEGVDSGLALTRANVRRRNAAAEPWRTITPASHQFGLFARSGWPVTESADGASSSLLISCRRA